MKSIKSILTAGILFSFFTINYVLGDPVTKTFPVGSCSGINIACSGMVHLQIGDENSLKISCSPQYMENITVNTDNNILNINYYNQNKNQWSFVSSTVNRKDIRIDLTLKQCNQISVVQDAKIIIEGNINADKLIINDFGSAGIECGSCNVNSLSVNITGSGTVNINELNVKNNVEVVVAGSSLLNIADMNSPDNNFTLTGSGTINIRECKLDKTVIVIFGSGIFSIQGTGESVTAKVDGSGRCFAGTFKSNIMHLKALGASNVEVNVNKELFIDVFGNAVVNVVGNPEVKTKNIYGSGSVILQSPDEMIPSN